MKCVRTALATTLLFGSLASGALAADGILLKQQATSGSYCHMKFPAISDATLFTDHPELQTATSVDVIDFYGPCDERPTAKDQVMQQREEQNRDWRE